MKKKIVLSLTLVLSLAMMSLTAFAAAPKSTVSADKSSAKNGDEVVVTVKLGTEDGSMSADVVTENLEVVGVTSDLSMSSAAKLNLASFGGSGATATYTCKVTGEAGAQATFRLTNIARGENTDAPSATGEEESVVVAIADEEPTNPEEPTEPSNPEEPTNPTNPTNPADPTNPSTPNGGNNGSNSGSGSNNNQNGSNSGSGNLDKAPNTGDTTASVWPLALIGCMGVAAAVVAGKKLAYRR